MTEYYALSTEIPMTSEALEEVPACIEDPRCKLR